MNDLLVGAVVGAALALAVGAGVVAGLGRPPGRVVLAGCAVVEVVYLVLAGSALVAMAGGERPAELVVFLAYLVGTAVVLPLAVLWSLAEPTRWSNLVVAVAGLTVMAMTARMVQTWDGVVPRG